MAFANTTGTRIINFEDIEGIIAEQNIDVQINQNDRLKSKVGFADLKRTIKDLEDDLEDIDSQRDQLRGDPDTDTDPDKFSQVIALGAEKRILLDTLKQLERNVVDRPTLEAMTDLQASMSDDSQTRFAESIFIAYNQLKLGSTDISLGRKTIENQLAAMQLQESLGMISRNNMNDLKTKLVDMQTKLESTKLQQELFERQLKNALNDQENTLVIGSVPSVNEELIIEDEEADLKKALENSYTIKLQEQQIVSLQTVLDRAKKDNGLSSNQYKGANYELTNANLKLTQLKDTLKSDYYTMIDDIVKMQSNLRLAEQSLEDHPQSTGDIRGFILTFAIFNANFVL